MPRYAAFLRGVNLGSRRKVSSAQLREILEGAGFEEVQPFRTSGNVVFDSSMRSSAKLEKAIERALADALGFDVTVFVRTAAELREIAAQEPFGAAEGKLQVSLLAKAPSAAVREAVLGHATDADRLAFAGRELYWLPRGRMTDAEIDVVAVDKLVEPSTRRTMGTLQLIADKFLQ